MAKVIKMDPQQWAKWLGDLGQRFEPAMLRGIEAGAQRCVPLLQQSTRSAPPASPRGGVGAIDTGMYLAAWRAKPITKGTSVFNNRPQAAVIEAGRRPSNVGSDGIRNLQAWASRRLQLNERDARNAAWAIAQTLKERKLEPRKVMNSIEKEMIRAVEEEIVHELDAELGRR